MSRPLLVFGLHAVRALLEAAPGDARRLLVARGESGALGEIVALAADHTTVQHCSREELDRATGGGAHQGVALECTRLPELDERRLLDRLDEAPRPWLLLVLDGVQDPHNLGACLRSANAAGAQAVIVPRDRACGLTPTVVKVASGAVGPTGFARVTNLARCLRQLRERGVWLVGVTQDAPRTLYEVALDVDLALVLGAEGSGLRRLTREACDALAAIPMAGSVTSLNVSVSSGIALFEARRQRASGA